MDRIDVYKRQERETMKLLEDTGFSEHADEMKQWYDGYHFGKTDIYCPWDVLNLSLIHI